MKWGLDVDGVLADFNTSFIALIKQLTGRSLPAPSPTYPDVWAYHKAAGVSPVEDNKLWTFIKNNSLHFWSALNPLPGVPDLLKLLRRMHNEGDAVYFITSRPGLRAKMATEGWLDFWGFPGATVLISTEKGPIAKGLDLDVFIDDKWENCMEVKLLGPKGCRVFLLDAPYNQDREFEGITRVKSVNEMIDIVKGGTFRAAA